MHYSLTGSGFPLVFQHGLGASLSQVVSLLGGMEGIRLLTADMSGHGKTPFTPDRLPSFDNYADDLAALMRQQGIQQAVLGGISMGSGIALNMAVRYPGLVRALVLVRPAWAHAANPKNLAILNAVANAMEMENGEAAFKSRGDIREMQASLPLAATSIFGMFDREQVAHTPVVLRAMVGDFPVSADQAPHVPALVIGNDQDPLHPWAMAEYWHERLPGSRLCQVVSRYRDNGEHSAQVRSLIGEFIRKTLN